MLSFEEKKDILSSFPNVKLSYENIAHKKVSNCDLILLIPDGNKCFIWFTIFNEKYVCILLELENNNKKQIKNVKIITTCFSTSLCYGTIFYGTIFNSMNNIFFSVEDVFYYKGYDISSDNWKNKFNKLLNIFNNDIKQLSYNNNFVVFGLPIMLKTNDDILNIINKSNLPYKISSIHYIQFNIINNYFILSFDEFISTQKNNSQNESLFKKEFLTTKNYNKSIVFEVKPDIQNDIYHLYSKNDKYYNIACIPDYKTSIMMNSLFRKIKENDDLDKLEESDDEDEFENANIDKFVYLDRSLKFECIFNKRFKKWVPIKLVDNNICVTDINEIKNTINRLTSKHIK
jgi:hypothetical protein